MKNVINTLLLAAALLPATALTTLAEGGNNLTVGKESMPKTASFQTNLFSGKANRLTMVIVKANAGKAHVRIKDAEHNLLYSNRVADDSVMQHFWISELAPGSYTFEITADDGEKQVYPFTKS